MACLRQLVKLLKKTGILRVVMLFHPLLQVYWRVVMSNPIHAMINLIEHERDYESQVRFIKEAKTIDESGTTMMRNN